MHAKLERPLSVSGELTPVHMGVMKHEKKVFCTEDLELLQETA